MPTCPRCAATTADGARFCPSCGTSLASAGPDFDALALPPAPPGPPVRTGPPPPPPAYAVGGSTVAPAAPGPTTPTIHVDWRALLRGNWLGCAILAGAALLTTAVIALVVALLVKPPDFGTKHTLDLTAALAAGAFGARFGLHAKLDGVETSGSTMLFPLTLTVIAAVVLVLGFRRLTRDHTTAGATALDAVRVGLLSGVVLLIVSLIFRGDNKHLGRGYGSDLSASATDEVVHYNIGAVSAFFVPLLLVTALLLLTLVADRERWRHPRVRAVLDVVAPALRGWFVLFLLLPLAGLVGFLLLGFGQPSVTQGEDTTSLHTILAVVFAGLANGGMLVLSLGGLAKVGGSGTYDDGPADRGSDGEYHHLWQQIAHDEPGLWATPAVLLVVLAVCAWLVVRRASGPRAAVGSLATWAAGLLVVVPILVWLSGAHGSGSAHDPHPFASGTADYSFSGSAGAHGVETTFFLTGFALLVALAGAALSPRADLAGATAGLRRTLAGLQTRPGTPPTRPEPAGADWEVIEHDPAAATGPVERLEQ